MIPKKIHYCWFGGKPMPRKEQKCVESWKKKMPEYEIVRWDENNFDINSSFFTKEAYSVKKFAFVADYVRVYVLFHEGGIYLDTDVEIVKSLTPLLQCSFLTGFETEGVIQTGLIGCEAHNALIKKLFDYYQGRHFFLSNKKFDETPNSAILAILIGKEGFLLNNVFQKKKGIEIYPSDFFCPIDQATWEVHPTENTYCIHYLSGSWLPFKDRMTRKLKTWIGNMFSFKLVRIIRNCIR